MYLITGANGQLGRELQKRLPSAITANHQMLDISSWIQVERFVKNNNIDTIINCAAFTAVDLAESQKIEAIRGNVDGPRNLAAVCDKVIHISTDYVFDGSANTPYKTDDKTNPLSWYGKTKRRGEQEVLNTASKSVVIRTSWLYSPHGRNFVKTMRDLGSKKDEINVVADQIGSPTYAGDLADAIVKIIPQLSINTHGIYHYSNEGVCSWYEFATEIMKQSGLKCKVNPITTAEYPTPTPRPAYSVLDKTKIKEMFGVQIPHWKASLAKCIKEM